MEQAPKVEVTSSGTSASTAGFGVADPSWDSDPNDMARDALCQAVGDLRVEIIRRGHVKVSSGAQTPAKTAAGSPSAAP